MIVLLGLTTHRWSGIACLLIVYCDDKSNCYIRLLIVCYVGTHLPTWGFSSLPTEDLVV